MEDWELAGTEPPAASKKRRGSNKAVDWAAIEKDWLPGLMPVLHVSQKHGVSRAAIEKHFDKLGMKRDLKPQIMAKVMLKPEGDPLEKQGFVYVVYLDDSSGVRFYKIGMAWAFTPDSSSTSARVPFDVCVACAYFVGNMRAEERYLHALFSAKRVRGEWFRLDSEDLALIGRRAVLV